MKLKPTLKNRALQQLTARDFGGGLDIVDSELNLTSRFSTILTNMVPDENGAIQTRWGTRLYADVATSRIIGMEYFYVYIIVAFSDGTLKAIDASGTITTIWNGTIAAALPGSPGGWSAVRSVCFAQFDGALIITNGIDKPIIVTKTLATSYLQDLGSGSNINVPICKYCCTHSNYLVMAGDPLKPGRLHISNVGTSGTWVGDLPPNDAITFDADKYAPDTIGEITGIQSFRDKLVVFFPKWIISLTLGAYSQDTIPVHNPTISDTIASFGAVSNRSVINTGDQMFFVDYTGVSSIRRALISGEVTPDRMGLLVDTDIQRALADLENETLRNECYAVHDRRENRIMFFIPPGDDPTTLEEYHIFTMTLQKGGKAVAWSRYEGWNWQAACVSLEGRVFFGSDHYVAYHGSRYEPVLSDYEGILARPDGAVVLPVFVSGVYVPDYGSGVGINFEWELPYVPLKDRTVWKSMHYVSMDTSGAAQFTLDLWTDDLKKRLDSGETWSDGTLFTDGWGFSPLSSNAYASMDFVAGDFNAHGIHHAEPTPFRPASSMNLYAMFARFRFIKLAFKGTSYSHLRVVAVSLYYTTGSIY